MSGAVWAGMIGLWSTGTVKTTRISENLNSNCTDCQPKPKQIWSSFVECEFSL